VTFELLKVKRPTIKLFATIFLPTLRKLMDEPSPIKEKVPLILAHLVENHEELQKMAGHLDLIGKLAPCVRSSVITSSSSIILKEVSRIMV
jgi:hypothetical protein